jgi:hypothetical protein
MSEAQAELERWREWARQWAAWPGPPLPKNVPLTDDLLRQLIASRVQEAGAAVGDVGAEPAAAAPRAAKADGSEAHRTWLAEEPFAYDGWHARFSHYRRQDQLDAAFCVARALVFLEQANADEVQLHEKFHRPEFRQARQRLGEDVLRRHVFHPDEDLGLTGVFGLVAPSVAAGRAGLLPPYLRSRERIDIATDRTPVARMAKYVRDVLNVGQPDLYLVDEAVQASALNAQRDGRVSPSLVVSRRAGEDQRALAFALGRAMADFYLPHYTFVALDRSVPDLEVVLRACRCIAGLDVGSPPDIEAVARELQSRLPSSTRGQLRQLFERFDAANNPLDARRWARGAEITAYRVGLLLADDLGVAAQHIRQEREGFTLLAARDRIHELVLYSVSDDYFAARKSLGLTVG